MTAKDHSKLLGIFFAIHAALYGFGGLLAMLIYGGMGGYWLANGRNAEERFLGGVFIFAMVVLLLISLVLVVPQILAAFKLIKNKSGARFWAIFAAITSLLSFPLGTALGIYGLWFLFGEQGKQFYNAGGTQMPPPPQNWR
jgi:hypothetical protein